MERYSGVKLEKKKLNIFGKYKEFDLVNVDEIIVGDVKCYTFEGHLLLNLVQYPNTSGLWKNLNNQAEENVKSS